MSTNLEYRERERQRKRENSGTGQRRSTRKGASVRAREREKKLGDTFCWGNNMKFCSDGMLAATRVTENERQWKKKSEQEHVRHFLHKTCNKEVSGSFTLQSCKTTAKNVQKKFAARAKLLFS